jgi:hypothetical protein
MDTELYQILSLALLGLVVLVLLAVLSSLRRLRKTLAGAAGAKAAEAAPDRAEEQREPEAATIAEEPSEIAPAPAAAATPEPEPEPSLGTAGLGAAGFGAPPAGSEPVTQEPAATTPEPGPAAETPTDAPAWDEQEDKTAAQYQPPLAREPEPEPEPAQPAETGYGLEGTGATAVGGPATEPQASQAEVEEEPQEQPFERDGKWFFRRGDELLTYEETTGQWVPAGGPQPGTAAPSPTPVQEDDTQRFETGPEASQETEEPPAASTEGGFWKCPSCGAVNGSTATTCRMCFTARP